MDETCLELQCLRLISPLSKPPSDSDTESDTESSIGVSELITRFYALRECPHSRLASPVELLSLRRNQHVIVVENYPRSLTDLIQEHR